MASAVAADLAGLATVTDGDTLRIAGERVRLFGIDAPETKQTCERNGLTWLCGQEAAAFLRSLTEGRKITCEEMDRDLYGRIVAVCRLPNGRDVGAALVSAGLAMDYRKYSAGRYAELETAARSADRGLWAGKFVAPWEWRQRR